MPFKPRPRCLLPPVTSSTLLAAAALALGSAGSFVAIGLLVARRAPPQGTLASIAFPAFWHSAAIVYASQGARALAAALGYDTWALVVGLEQLTTVFYCLSGASLAYYVLYLLTGRAWLALPIAAYYLVMAVALRMHVAAADPIGYEVTEWQVNYVYAGSLQTPAYSVTLALTAAPLFAAIVGYASLAWRLHDHALQWRVRWVAGGLVLWVAMEVFAFATGLASTPTGEVLRRAAGLGTALIVAVGYARPSHASQRATSAPD